MMNVHSVLCVIGGNSLSSSNRRASTACAADPPPMMSSSTSSYGRDAVDEMVTTYILYITWEPPLSIDT